MAYSNETLALTHNQRGIEKQRSGRYTDAIVAFNNALHFDPTCTGALKNRSWLYSVLGSYDLVIEDCSRVIKLNSNDVEAYMRRGCASSVLGYYHAAITDFSVVIEFDPKYSWAYLVRGDAHYTVGNYRSAIQDYSSLIGLGLKSSWVYFRRGDAHYAQENYRLAIYDYDMVISLDSSSAEVCRKMKKAYGKLSPVGKSDVEPIIYRALTI